MMCLALSERQELYETTIAILWCENTSQCSTYYLCMCKTPGAVTLVATFAGHL